MDDGISALDRAKLEHDNRRLTIEEKKIALESSWPRKWGSVLLGGMFSLVVTFSGYIFTNWQNYIQREETKRARISSDNQIKLANSRLALEMYFKNLNVIGPDDNARGAHHLEMIATIAADERIQGILRRIIQETIEARQAKARSREGATAPSDVAEGLPDLVQRPADGKYRASDFTAYIQHPQNRRNDASRLEEALDRLGLRTPALEQMRDNVTPDKNEIRYYRSDHEVLANEIKAKLEADLSMTFIVRRLQRSRYLPNGIMEFWIGKSN